MRASLLTQQGRAVPTKGARVRCDGLIYVVTEAEQPTELDDTTSITEVDMQPAVASSGTPVLPARIV